MMGAVIGDIAGSVYERHNIKTKDFPFWREECRFTDDTVMTCAVFEAFRKYHEGGCVGDLRDHLVREMKTFGRLYPDRGYGAGFKIWLASPESEPYGSFGNGSAMRVSAVTAFAADLEEAQRFAAVSASVTHNHPEGIKGAVAVATAVFLAEEGKSREDIRTALSEFYSLDFTLDEIRDRYTFDVTCQGSVPQAVEAFLEGRDFEDVIRNAVSIGGDSDTIAAMAGSIGEAFFGIPEDMEKKAYSYLDNRLAGILRKRRKYKCQRR